jgi:Ser/Thr protein kinase RdoA (MazF antagonist)
LQPFVAAYNEVTPLTGEELGMLRLLLRVRLATTVAMGHWRSAELGDDDEYRKKSLATEDDAERFLHALNEMGEERFRAQLLLQGPMPADRLTL